MQQKKFWKCRAGDQFSSSVKGSFRVLLQRCQSKPGREAGRVNGGWCWTQCRKHPAKRL